MRKPSHLKIYRDRAGKWRWRLVAGNGKIVADSGQGYSRRDHVVSAVIALPRIWTNSDGP